MEVEWNLIFHNKYIFLYCREYLGKSMDLAKLVLILYYSLNHRTEDVSMHSGLSILFVSYTN